MEINFDIKLTSKQKEAYNALKDKDTRYLICRWSRQSGKSVFAEIVMIEYLCQKNTFSGYISPTFQLGRKVYSEMIKLLQDTNIIKKANATTLTIESIYGSTLQFFSVEAYTSIRGNTISGVLIMDEAAYFQEVLPNGENLWANVIYPITKARKPKVIVISTPCGKTGLFFDLYHRALNNKPGYKEITSTIYSDDLVSKEEIEEIKNTIPELAFRQEFLVEFLDSSITFFTGFEKCFKDNYKYNNNTHQYIGLDPSGNGNDECILTKINDEMQVMQYTIKGTFDSKYKQIADIINNTPYLDNVLVETNGLGAPFYNELIKLIKRKNKVKEWTTTNTSKEKILSNLAVAIEQQKISFNNEDKLLYSQFGTFICTVTKNKHLKLEAKAGFHDDKVMSLAIALEAKNSTKKFDRSNYRFTQSKTYYNY